MKSVVKSILFLILRLTGLPFLVREFVQKNKVTILMFHDIESKYAKKYFSYLKKNYKIIKLNDFIYSKSKLPKKSLIITFDDGHIGNYELLDILRDLDIEITVFLCAGIINTNRHFWFKYIKSSSLKESFKKISNSERLEKLEKEGFNNEKEFTEAEALNNNMIKEMRPYVNFQAHTIYHPCLPMCNNEEAFEEINNSKQILENEFHLDVNAIAYPNGDYCERDIEIVKQSGYKCALTTNSGFNTLNSDFFQLKRLSVSDTKLMNEFIVKSSGIWWVIKGIFSKKK